jgi:DNA modification methylase
MTALVLRGDARHLPLPDGSVDLIVTSPPYWALRSYTDGGQHYPGQIGSEATPAEWVDALIACTVEWMRVLKPSGSIFVNLGDKYSSPGGHIDNTASSRLQGRPNLRKQGRADRSTDLHGVAAKSLFGLPWRYALRCIDELGLILRAEIIWSKPNGLPESVTDRVRRSHEQWFHFTVQPRYYSAVDGIREPYAPGTPGRYATGYTQTSASSNGQTRNPVLRKDDGGPTAVNPLGKLPGSVWSIPSEPLTVPDHLGVEHFAAFPMEWPRRIILGWSPPGICTACGEGRRPATLAEYADAGGHSEHEKYARAQGDRIAGSFKPQEMRLGRANRLTTVIGYTCACPEPTAPTRPALVLDPFGGTGTTALVASMHGRIGITIDRSADYSRLAAWRTTDPAQRAKALQVDRPPIEVDGQYSLLDLVQEADHA